MADAETAWAEAVAANDAQEVLLVTLELHHPAFIEEGQPSAVRAVADTVDHDLKLEDGAPLNGGQRVLFKAIPFAVDEPQIGSIAPEVTIRMDNVSREIAPFLEAAVSHNEPITVIMRGYLSSDPDTVAHGPFQLNLRQVTRRNAVIEGTMTIARTQDARFLRRIYDMDGFPALLGVS